MAGLGVWIKSGSRNETFETEGISHLLEKMLFNDGKTKTSNQWANFINSLGRSYTTPEHTGFLYTVPNDYVGLTLKKLSHMFQAKSFDKKEFISEKQKLLKLLAESRQDPNYEILETSMRNSFNNQSLGLSCNGNIDTVESLTEDMLLEFMAVNYIPSQMVLVGTGNIEHDVLCEFAVKNFENLPTLKPIIFPQAKFTGGVRNIKKTSEEDHVVISFEGISQTNKLNAKSILFSGLLGLSESSLLHKDFIEKMGIANEINVYDMYFSDIGKIDINAACDPKKTPELISNIYSYISDLSVKLTEDVLQQEKQNCIKEVQLGKYDIDVRMRLMAQQLLYFHRVVTTDEIKEKINSVTKLDIIEFADNLLKTKPNVVTLGNYQPH